MPGFYGKTYNIGEDHETINEIRKMGNLVSHAKFYSKEEDYIYSGVACSHIHLSVKKELYVQETDDAVKVWLEGEIYNLQQLASKNKICTSAIAEKIIADLYLTKCNAENKWSFIRELSGEYALLIYDKKNRMLHFITDRYGSKPIYYYEENGLIAWAHEVKAFLGLSRFVPEILSETFNEFMSAGYLTENKTWFKDVHKIPGSSVMSFDLQTRDLTERKYWNWTEIISINGRSNIKGITEELASMFRNAVRKRLGSNTRIGIPLSGGLDSRAILVSIPYEYREITTAYTFGKHGCDEIKHASSVANKLGVKHLIFELNESNWIDPRIKGVWISDGILDLLHMHGVEFLNAVKEHADIILSGILGGGLIGGLFLKEKKTTETEILEKRIAGRSIIGVTLESYMINQRLPFFDNELNEFILSIPRSLRANAKLYHKMLLSNYPEYFRNIPNANTGCAISIPNIIIAPYQFSRRLSRGIYKRYQIFSAPNSLMHDYTMWIKKQPAKSIFQEILLSKSALYAKYLPQNICESILADHLAGKSENSAFLCRILTFEIWLQQVFRNEFRGGI